MPDQKPSSFGLLYVVGLIAIVAMVILGIVTIGIDLSRLGGAADAQ